MTKAVCRLLKSEDTHDYRDVLAACALRVRVCQKLSEAAFKKSMNTLGSWSLGVMRIDILESIAMLIILYYLDPAIESRDDRKKIIV